MNKTITIDREGFMQTCAETVAKYTEIANDKKLIMSNEEKEALAVLMFNLTMYSAKLYTALFEGEDGK